MKIGILSDTHFNIAFIEKVSEYLIKQEKVDRLYHLGDNFSDVKHLQNCGVPILNVPGLYCMEYNFPHVPKLLVDEADGWRIGLVHALDDAPGERRSELDILCFGHTHVFKIDLAGHCWMINPGHLKEDVHKNQPASFGILTLGAVTSCKIMNLRFETLLEKTLIKK